MNRVIDMFVNVGPNGRMKYCGQFTIASVDKRRVRRFMRRAAKVVPASAHDYNRLARNHKR